MSLNRRGGIFGSLPPVTKNLLIINVAVFVICQLLARTASVIPERMVLYNFQSENFYPFQLITHMFMHASIGHIFFNMFAVFMFGRAIETVAGSKKFFILYILSGFGAAFLQLTIYYIQFSNFQGTIVAFNNAPSPDAFWEIVQKYNYMLSDKVRLFAQNWFENPDSTQYIGQAAIMLNQIYTGIVNNTAMLGASGAVFGVLVAFGMMFPNVELMLIFVPIPIKAKYFIPIYAVLELFLGIANFRGDNIAHFAHLGGAIIGFIIVKMWKKNQFKVY